MNNILVVEDDFALRSALTASLELSGFNVVAVERDSCGGCFNKIPPQRQMDIKNHKKIIVCEHCGRLLVDVAIEEEPAKA